MKFIVILAAFTFGFGSYAGKWRKLYNASPEVVERFFEEHPRAEKRVGKLIKLFRKNSEARPIVLNKLASTCTKYAQKNDVHIGRELCFGTSGKRGVSSAVEEMVEKYIWIYMDLIKELDSKDKLDRAELDRLVKAENLLRDLKRFHFFKFRHYLNRAILADPPTEEKPWGRETSQR